MPQSTHYTVYTSHPNQDVPPTRHYAEQASLGFRDSHSSLMFQPSQFAAYLCTQSLSDSTVRAYRALYVRWLDWCATHGRDPTQFDPLDVRGWSRTLQGRALMAQAAAMVNHACRMNQTAETGQAVPVPRPPRRRSRALDPEDAATLERQAHEAGIAGTCVLVGLYTAARRSEIAAMEWERVDWKRRTLTFWRPKTSDWHCVPLHPVLYDHLEQRWIEGGRWLFAGRWGGHVNPAQIGTWVKQVGEACGVKLSTHVLRHTAISEANDRSRDPDATQMFAGHVDPRQTSIYTRIRNERLAEVVSMIDYQAV